MKFDAIFAIAALAAMVGLWAVIGFCEYRDGRDRVRVDERYRAVKHLYICWWRPDILVKLQQRNEVQHAMCELVVNTNDLTAHPSEVDCPVCRNNFIEALPTGDGSKMTFDKYLAEQAEIEKRKAAEQAAKQSAWSTQPVQDTGWSTKPKDEWRT